MTDSSQKKIVLNSTFEEVERLEKYVEDLQKWAGFGDDDHARIMLTLSEAATNAIVHGNKENPDKKVIIIGRLSNNTLTLSVKDEGKGFNPDDLPNPLKEENLLNEGGRGVYLIEEYADKLEFQENGTKLKMVFKLE